MSVSTVDTPVAYYNEVDPKKAAWLRELIRQDVIAPGDVDERDIRDVVPTELSGYRQCHFFAGVGIWSYALRQAGWPDDRPVWTGSCPCQPFSEAGRGEGFADKRHLWPAWFHLIGQCRPPVIFGEQVASSDAKPWIDLVHDDLEALGYAFGPIVLPAAGFGAPHPRHRVYFVADAECERRDRRQRAAQGCQPDGSPPRWPESHDGSVGFREIGPTALADAERDGCGGEGSGSASGTTSAVQGTDGQRQRVRSDARPGRRPVVFRFDHVPVEELRRRGAWTDEHDRISNIIGRLRDSLHPGPVNGFWRDADWLRCSDGLWAPVEPGSFPLADGIACRMGLLRGYGDGIAAPAAEAFIRAYMESIA